uniref:Uncharacterized protein n=1 Tax=Tetranychus urticae TaxID=32264 RepID=A0A158P4B3_TETUR
MEDRSKLASEMERKARDILLFQSINSINRASSKNW